jgi:formylglycine-generating enzyme required for sulfatase activity
MEKSFIKIALVLILLLTLATACLNSKVKGVKLNKKELSLNVGDTETLRATVKPQSVIHDGVKWTTDNSDVVDIRVPSDYGNERCIVTAKSEGKAIITATVEEFTATCTVAVKALQPIEPEMIFVEGGTFMMGSDYNILEQPIHQVTLSSFNIAKYPVTQKEWKTVMGTNPSNQKGDNLPVDDVSWDEVKEYITRLNNATKKKYRLPTEAEWEYAAGGGNKSTGKLYSGSNNIDEVAWYTGNTPPLEKLQPVGTKAPNELGIYDMSGNVWEWCNDWYGNYPYTSQTDPQGLNSDHLYRKIFRGGCGNCYSTYCRVTNRHAREYINSTYGDVGFRLVHP